MSKIPYPLKLALFLVILGGICGALLAAVNAFTKPVIEELKRKEIQLKLEKVAPIENVVFEELLDFEKVDGIITAYVGKVNEEVVAIVYLGRAQGFASTIEALVGIDVTTGNVLGLSIVAESETAPGIDVRAHDYGFPGNKIEDAEKSFEKLSGATYTSDGVKELVLIVQAQYAQDYK